MTNTTDTSSFLEGSKSAVHSIRQALADVLASVDGDPSTPQEISRRFGLDKTLTWRIARVIRVEDIWEAVPHIPRRPSIQIFARAMAKHGAPADKIDTLFEALGEFERFIEVHSGDRETLEAMIAGEARNSDDKRMETFRKNAFLANRAIWGVQARLQIAFNVLTPSAKHPDMLDMCTVCGLVGLRRLRTNVPWAVASAVAWEYPEETRQLAEKGPLPLHPGGLVNGVPALTEYCSDPLPELRAVRVGGATRFEITGGPVGKTAASTVLLGWKWPVSASMYCEDSPDECGEHGMHLSTPVETAIFDLFVHKSITFAMNPTAAVYSKLPGGPQYPAEGRGVGELPMPDTVIDLGASPPDTTTPELPRYRDAVAFAAEQMGHPIREFHGFRFRLTYPPIPTLALLQHPLLPKRV